MAARWSVTRALLWIFAISAFIGTLLGLVLGLDLVAHPPDIPDTVDLPGRLEAIRPYLEARWPLDLATNLAAIVAFGALALLADPLAALAGSDDRAGLLRVSIIVSAVLALAGALIYVGATRVTIDQAYCDCGFKTEESISQFWAISIIQGATDWLSHGSSVFAAIALVAAGSLIRRRGLPPSWRWLAWAGALALIVGMVLGEVVDGPIGDLVSAAATGILLPVWALMLAVRLDRLDPAEG
ncbi:MAG TPA: hypothetical protein VGQ31_04215 [Candidatus Limnocylindrales bacterium]|jgi:hypothetical protein|nr:hypothetical protein [Candidatus Limnocylindrales bacterium]